MTKRKSTPENPTPRQGFAVLDPDKRREVCAKGGRAAHAAGTAHVFTSDEAREAGTKGGRTHSREHMAEIGRKGGIAKGQAQGKKHAAKED